MKIDRLIGILSILLQEEKTTAPELAERFEVSRRTINRDIEDLCKAGIPIKTAQGTGGGISIMDGYRMDRTILSSKDMQMILAGLRSLDSVSGSRYYSQLMEKIQTGSSEFISGRDSMLIDLSSWYKGSLDEDDKINGLLSGGDDYITKPFSLRELEARIVTNIKREERHQQKTEYRFMDEMLIDYSEKIVAIAGHRMEFTKIEYQIIEFLSMHPGQVFDKERIYAQVCGYDAEGDSRTITELVRRIRKKIADYSEKEYIETVWGIGYRWKK